MTHKYEQERENIRQLKKQGESGAEFLSGWSAFDLVLSTLLDFQDSNRQATNCNFQWKPFSSGQKIY